MMTMECTYILRTAVTCVSLFESYSSDAEIIGHQHMVSAMSSSPLDAVRTKSILFLTTPEYSLAPSIADPYSTPANIAALPVPNKALAEALALAGADVRFSSWKFPA